MKKVLLFLLVFVGYSVLAQEEVRQNAYNYQSQAQMLIDSADDYLAANNMDKAAKQMNDAKLLLEKAKSCIDAATKHKQTKKQAKTWHYYAMIYYKIGVYPELYDLEPNAFDCVLMAIAKIKEMDPDYYQDMNAELSLYVTAIDNTYYQMGVDSFNNGDYEESLQYFHKASKAAEYIDTFDDAAVINMATCAIKLGEYDVAANVYEALLSKGYEDATIYSGLINAYRELGQYKKSLDMITVARAKYPNDSQLINDMINTYLSVHREDEIVDQIDVDEVCDYEKNELLRSFRERIKG